jgi:hypothetical protein
MKKNNCKKSGKINLELLLQAHTAVSILLQVTFIMDCGKAGRDREREREEKNREREKYI